MPGRRQLLTAAIALAAAAPAAWAGDELQVMLRAPDGGGDPRNELIGAIARLALERTRGSHGGYELVLSAPMNKRRALLTAARNQAANLLLPVPSDAGRAAGLAAVPFPIHLGLHGYRVCFVNPARREQLRAVRSVQDLKPFVHVQGSDWMDVPVLRANGLKVELAGNYPVMFQMVATGRADLFCRSILEAGPELAQNSSLSGLVLDNSLLLSYDLPGYFHTHPSNTALIERMTTGLKRAYADGSLQALLREHVQPHLGLLRLDRRRLIRLASPPGWPPPAEPRMTLDQLLKGSR